MTTKTGTATTTIHQIHVCSMIALRRILECANWDAILPSILKAILKKLSALCAKLSEYGI